MDDTFLTIHANSEGLFKEKGSKFISYAYPVKTEEDVKEKIDALKKLHHNARHHCWAYRLGPLGEFYRANDDGEPSNSAGKPILGQLQSYNLTNIAIVVVRYFGGTLLGVGGLISAYRQAAQDAIENNDVVEEIITHNLSFYFDYISMNRVMKVVKNYGLSILHQNFDSQCEIEISCRQSDLEAVTGTLKKIESITFKE